MDRKFIKPIIMVVAILLVVVLAAGLIAQTVMKKKQGEVNNPGIQAVSKETLGKVYDGEGNELKAGTTYYMPESLLFSTSGEDAKIELYGLSAPAVSVSVEQSFRYNKVKIDWGTTFEDGTDASSYVKVTPMTDGSSNATVECLRAFSQPIYVNAMSRTNHSNKASCRVDYVKRFGSCGIGSIMGSDFSDASGFEIEPSFMEGTVKPDVKLKYLYAYINEDMQRNIKNLLTFDITIKSYQLSNVMLTNVEGYSWYSYDDDVYKYSDLVEGFDNFDEEHQTAIKYAWYNGWLSTYDKYRTITLDYEIVAIYNGVQFDSVCESDMCPQYSYLSGSCDAEDLEPVLSLNANIAF